MHPMQVRYQAALRHDVDNIKGDSFTGILYEDDSEVEILHIRKGVDRENPRIEVKCQWGACSKNAAKYGVLAYILRV